MLAEWIFCLALAAAGQVARVLTQPPLSPEEVASAEAALQANPEDLQTRLRLLTHYRESFPVAPHDDPGKRAARLRHIIWLIEHHPETIDAASPLFYVFRSGGPYADAADYELVRGAWLRSPDAVNAARFLFVEDKQEGEQLLTRAVAGDPANRRMAANLGFLYAMEILGLDNFAGDLVASVPASEREQTRRHAESELENCANALVLAGAATAIPNLSMRASRGRPVDPELFRFSSALMARARNLAPADEALRGPMPLIEHFQETQRAPGVPQMVAPPSRIRIGGPIQKMKLIEGPQPKYPAEAMKAGIEGDVRFSAVIGRDGAVLALTTLGGHPLLVPAALEAVRQWRYHPTLLNGNPVEVATEIVVSFPPK